MSLLGKKEKAVGLKIIIIGCGKVGATLVGQLCKEGHDITVIDKNANKIQSITNLYDVMGIVGNGASYETQIEAGIAGTDLLIAVTASDELNLLCCTIAKQVGNCAAIARVRTPDYSKEVSYLREKLGLATIINPDLQAATEASRILSLPTALEVGSFAHGMAQMVTFKIPEENVLDGMNLIKLSQTINLEILVCAVERDGQVSIPSGQFVLHSGDIISFVSTRKTARIFLKKIGFKTKQVKNAMIIGGGRTAHYLASQLLAAGIDVKLIEQDQKRCEELSILLPEAVVINGDGTDEELLKEEGIENVEAFVPLTGIDEENIMLTLHAKKISNAKLITKINRLNFHDVVSDLDLGSILYPRMIASEAILKYVRAMKASIGANIETLYHILDSRAEAIEFKVQEESKVTGKNLATLSLKKDLLVCAITRKGKVIIPSGHDEIQVGDSVMIVTTHTGFNDITDILA